MNSDGELSVDPSIDKCQINGCTSKRTSTEQSNRFAVQTQQPQVIGQIMGVGITYMGTKQALAPAVREVIERAQDGTVLDLFSGMCAVGEAIGGRRQIWNNDVQLFASEVARALFTSTHLPMTPVECADAHFLSYRKHRMRLQQQFARSLQAERRQLEAPTFADFEDRTKQLSCKLKLEIASCTLRHPHLFAVTYAGTYFGVQQAIEADAIVHALNVSHTKTVTNRDQRRWGYIALGRALLKVANSTGHFAQFLRAKEKTYQRQVRLRRRSLWEEWLSSLHSMKPVGSAAWRKGNKVFQQNCLTLLPRLAKKKSVGVIYADPPYTDDQYSRYYHIFETLLYYDYPIVTGAGLYRPNRFQTPFSTKSLAASAMKCLIEGAAKTEADLILSYPTNGLLVRAGHDLLSMLKRSFRKVEVAASISHLHSTFGASKGPSRAKAVELLYFARAN